MLLALTVLNWHYRVTPFNFIFSFSAVFIFMMISGFYMAMVIDQKYGTTPLGIITFYGARLVRLLPAYWVVLGLCYLFALNPGAPARSIWEILNDVFIVPRAFWETITGTVGGGGGLYLGQMYTVALEMMFYAIAPFIVLRKWPVIVLFALSAAYTRVAWWYELPRDPWQYQFFPATLPYFLGGVLAYRLYLIVAKWRVAPFLGYAALPLGYVAAMISPSRDQIWTDNGAVFAFYAFAALAVPFLFIASKNCRWDRLVGDLSYPFYIVHVPAIWLVWATPWLGGKEHGGLAVLGLSIVFSVALYALVDRPVDKWRHWATKRIKETAKLQFRFS
jgi:peptidoglycan/LPS O-acetylase OafA/YrhL